MLHVKIAHVRCVDNQEGRMRPWRDGCRVSIGAGHTLASGKQKMLQNNGFCMNRVKKNSGFCMNRVKKNRNRDLISGIDAVLQKKSI